MAEERPEVIETKPPEEEVVNIPEKDEERKEEPEETTPLAPVKPKQQQPDPPKEVDTWKGDDLDTKLENAKGKNTISFNFTDARYQGIITKDRMEGVGQYTFSNGNVYDGQFKDGMFHGLGILYFPSGSYYKGTWENGRLISGQYFFKDQLKYEEKDWKYCTKEDRRFYHEIMDEKNQLKIKNMQLSQGIKPPVIDENNILV